MDLKSTAHKVGINVHHFEWCTKYRYNMLRQDKYKNFCEETLRETAARHNMVIREIGIMPEHIHVSVECPPSMSQSNALQLLKGNLSYKLFRFEPKFRLRYFRGHFFSPGAYAGSVGYTTVEIVDNYVRNQKDIHQRILLDFAGSPAPSAARS